MRIDAKVTYPPQMKVQPLQSKAADPFVLPTDTPSINLGPEIPIDLGTLNGKPLEMVIGDQDLGLRWSGSPVELHGPFPPGSPVTPEQRRLLDRSDAAYAQWKPDWTRGLNLVGAVHALYLSTLPGRLADIT